MLAGLFFIWVAGQCHNAAKVALKTIGRGPHAQRKDGIIELNVYSMQDKAAWVSGCIKRVLP